MGENQETETSLNEAYAESLRDEFLLRCRDWRPDLSRPQAGEVVGALVSRQIALAREIALLPDLWNEQVGALPLRTMIEVQINLAWILQEPEDRSRRFVLYGLGQHKLWLEHLKADVGDRNVSTPLTRLSIQRGETWLKGMRLPAFTEVDVGGWSGSSLREMADQVNCSRLYRLLYQYLSMSVHGMWTSLAANNLKRCDSPFHGGHWVPVVQAAPPSVLLLVLAARRAQDSLRLFDKFIGTTSKPPSALRALVRGLRNLNKRPR